MPSAPSVRANPTLPDPGSSATAGKPDDTAPAATTRFSVPPSAVALPAGAPSANPPLPFLAQLPADRISICSGQDPLAVFNPPFSPNLSPQSCPPPHLNPLPQLSAHGVSMSPGSLPQSPFLLSLFSLSFSSFKALSTQKMMMRFALHRLSKPNMHAGVPPFVNLRASAQNPPTPPPLPSCPCLYLSTRQLLALGNAGATSLPKASPAQS